jgi:hypothetical protein
MSYLSKHRSDSRPFKMQIDQVLRSRKSQCPAVEPHSPPTPRLGTDYPCKLWLKNYNARQHKTRVRHADVYTIVLIRVHVDFHLKKRVASTFQTMSRTSVTEARMGTMNLNTVKPLITSTYQYLEVLDRVISVYCWSHLFPCSGMHWLPWQ